VVWPEGWVGERDFELAICMWNVWKEFGKYLQLA